MKRIFLISIIVIGFFQPVFAENNAHKKAALDLLQTMNMSELLDSSINAALEVEINKNPMLAPFRTTMKQFFNTYMGAESLQDDFVELYMNAFTEQELVDLIEFHRTPTGQKAIKLAPALFQQGAQIGRQRVADNLPELQSMIKEEAERLQALQQQNNK